jgi:hypothetical protein
VSATTLTTEAAAEYLGVTVLDIYESRRRNQPPGTLGVRRGRRLVWRQDDLDQFLSGENPQPQDETFGSLDALVLEMRGVNRRLDAILAVLQRFDGATITYETTTEETEDE